MFLTKREGVELSGVRRFTYKAPAGPGRATHPYVRRYEAAVRFGQQAARGLKALLDEGFCPDLIIAHPGWGEALFVKDICPEAKLINFCEFYYAGRGLDVGFDPEDRPDFNAILRTRARNAHLLLSLEDCDAGVSPTHWQKSVHPPRFQDKIEVIFDGIDPDVVRPREAATVTLPDGRTIRRGDKAVTYVARNLEPYRGFRTFMRAVPHIQRLHPDADILVIGGDEVSCGTPPKGAATWREAMAAEVAFDPSRLHFLGRLPYGKYLDVLSVSAAHIYLTYAFVLSWSCVEAMGMGALVIGSDTPPVRELIRDGENGLLTDFFDSEALAAKVDEVLRARARFEAMRRAARATVVEHYSIGRCLPRWMELIERVTAEPVSRATRPPRVWDVAWKKSAIRK